MGADLAQELGPHASFLHCDIAQEKDVEALVDAAVRKHGRLDIMYNNAGVIRPIDTSIQDLNVEDMDKVYTVNVRGTLLGTKHAARVMIPAKKGVILATASIACILGGTCLLPYTISKNAIAGLIKTTSAELGRHGIRVNFISPPRGANAVCVSVLLRAAPRHHHPEDVANAALFLASDDARFISGHNLLVDGGFTASKVMSL